MPRPQKITFGEMRESGVRGVLIYCSDYHCSHYITASVDPWPHHIRLSDLSRVWSVRHAAGAEPTSGRIFTGTSLACSPKVFDPAPISVNYITDRPNCPA
jgi:hypothetical protein